MNFIGTISAKYGFRTKKRAMSPDEDLAHVTSEIVAWKACANK